MKAIFKREMLSYFTSPIGYVFIGVFMLLSGNDYRNSLFVMRMGNIGDILASCMFILVLLVPIITMRLLAEERNSRTDQLFLTAPVKVSDVVIGKFFAAFSVFLISVATTLPYLFIAASFGNVVFSEIIPAYLGYILMGALLISIGLLISSFTESQIVAAVLTYGVIIALFYAGVTNIGISFIDTIIDYVSILKWSNPFYLGIISVSNLVYYISFTILMLFITVRRVESRRWN